MNNFEAHDKRSIDSNFRVRGDRNPTLLLTSSIIEKYETRIVQCESNELDLIHTRSSASLCEMKEKEKNVNLSEFIEI